VEILCILDLETELIRVINFTSMSVAARSKALACGRSAAEIVGSNPSGALISVYCSYCVLSGRSTCFGLIIRPG
jgi:late competence protein required for DNA uptake (superfamily II DNA/RNA helicase)